MPLRIIRPYVPETTDNYLIVELARALDITREVQLYPRVSTADQMDNVSAQMQQDISFCVAYGWQERLVICDSADLAKSGQLPMDERPAFLNR